MNEEMTRRRERIEQLLDDRLSMIYDNPVDVYYQARDVNYLSQALLNMIRAEKEEV